MGFRNILRTFRKSRITGKRLEFEQRRSIFKYFKFEHQEKMDGAAKAQQFYKKVPKEHVLAPKYRLRPYSPRYHATEVLEFLKEGKPMNTAIVGMIIIYSFMQLFNQRRSAEKTLIDHYHPDTDTEVKILMKHEINDIQAYLNWDTLETEHLKD